MQAQAIPMTEYRRQLFVAQWRPRIAVLLLAMAMYPLAASPWSVPVLGAESLSLDALWPFTPRVARVTATIVPETRVPLVAEPLPAPVWVPPVAWGIAPVEGIGKAAITNIAIAISFVDGAVIEPGGQFSFDDVARSWDFQEDPRYVLGTATSARGLIYMRGGGVCWLSTAIWRAALLAGLPTDLRQSHLGLVTSLGPGFDATNTLVIRNDSDAPITLRAWLDEENVNVALFADGALGRKGATRGPERLSRGNYAVYQDVTWDDGTVTTSEFPSRYFW